MKNRKTKSGKTTRSLGLNIISTILAIGMNFFLAPYVVGKLGNEAYGFNSLSNNFSEYAALVTIALNYMGNRFIALHFHKKEMKEANGYYTSLFLGDSILALILTPVFWGFVFVLERVIYIPQELIWDVKLTFALTFATFIVTLLFTAFQAGAYVADRMDMYAYREMIYHIIKIFAIVMLYRYYIPHIYYISLGTLIATVVNGVLNYLMTKKLLPDLRIKREYFSFSKVKSLVSSGINFSFVSLGGVLSNGLDLLITNQFIDSYNMGILSVAKTITTALKNVGNSVVNVFYPGLMKEYAKGNIDGFVELEKRTMRITYAVMMVPMAGLTVFAKDFYRLWMSSYTEKEIELVTVLTWFILIGILGKVLVGCLPENCALANRLRFPTAMTLTQDVVSLITTLVLLECTDYGVYLVAIVSSIVNIIFHFIFSIPYTAYILERSVLTFYGTVFKGAGQYVILCTIFLVLKTWMKTYSWISFFYSILICGVLGYLLEFVLALNKIERKVILDKIRR